MSSFKQRLIHIHSYTGVTWLFIKRLLDNDPTLTAVYSYSLTDLQTYLQMKASQAKLFYSYLQANSPEQVKNFYQNSQIHTISIFEPNYPPILKQIYDPPWILYALGDVSLLNLQKQIAIVGTRTPTDLGSKSLLKLIPPLVKNEWTIVSGMAKGIDGLAHKVTIKNRGHTIAVLGSGFNYPYPASNLNLFNYMTNNQLVISEYPPHFPPNKWQFPARNRIISGLSKAVLVIEAKEKSGSLITADQALEQGRDVFAVPGPIYSPQSAGTNFLIQQGATLVTKAEDILYEYL